MTTKRQEGDPKKEKEEPKTSPPQPHSSSLPIARLMLDAARHARWIEGTANDPDDDD